MTPLRQQMIAALQLSGKGERTQQADVREVRLLAQVYNKSPDLLSEQQLQHDFLHRKNVDGLAPASMRICYRGIRFFYPHVLQRDWHILSWIRAQPTHRLSAIPRVEEVRRLLKAATPLHNQVYFTTVYSLELRLHEALYLQVSDLDGQRLQVPVHRGKGAKDRYVPLPDDTLARLRTDWITHRHETGLLPATGRNPKQGPTATSPMRRARVQGAFRQAKGRAGMTHAGHEDADTRLNSLMPGLLPGPPCVTSAPPLHPSIWSVIPLCPPRTERPAVRSKTAQAGTMAIASIHAQAVERNTASILPAATDTAHRVSITKPRRGYTDTWNNSSRGHTFSSPVPALRLSEP